MTIFILLDVTHYPIAAYRDKKKAMAALVNRPTCHMITLRVED